MDAKEAIEYAKKAKVLHIERYGDGKKISFYSTIIEALEKQVPKEPVVSNENHDEIEYLCPVCNRLVDNMNYCLRCGQRLNWDK